MQKDEKEKQIQYELKNKEMMNKFLDEINQIKNNVDKKVQEMEGKFDKICKRQEEIIDKGIANKYHQIILNTNTVGQFIKFDDILKEHFIMEVFKNLNSQNNVNKIILYYKLIDIDSLSKDINLPIIQFIKDNNHDLEITNSKVENLHENGIYHLL